MESELLIKISADAKNATAAFDDVKAKTKDLNDGLKTTAEVAGVAFAAMIGEVYLSVDAFHEADAANRSLINTLQNVGIYSEEVVESYRAYAEAISAATGISVAEITSVQTSLQAKIGQTKVTKDLTQAVLDYAAGMKIDVKSASIELGQAIANGTGMMLRQDKAIAGLATQQERYAEVLQFVNTKFKDRAAADNEASGGAKTLKTAYEELQVSIGSHFAPAVATANHALSAMLTFFRESPALQNTAVAIGTVVAAVLGLITAVSGVALSALAFSALSAAAAAVGIALGPVILIIGGIVAAIGGLTFVMKKFGIDWSDVWNGVKAKAAQFGTWATEFFPGIGKLISGAFTLDLAKMKAGLDQAKNSFIVAEADYKKQQAAMTAETHKAENDRIAIQKAAGDKAEAEKRAREANTVALQRAQSQLIQLELAHASDALIALKKKEIQELAELTNNKKKNEVDLLKQQLAETEALYKKQAKNDAERDKAFAATQLEAQKQEASQHIQVVQKLNDEELKAVKKTQLTEADTDKKIQLDILSNKIKNHNAILSDQKKYGAAVATLNSVLASEEVQGAKQLSSDLIAMGQSKNDTLKSIGQAAAVSQIIIGTAESVSSISQQVPRVIPFPFSIPVIAALVGARIAFGAEQISNVKGAAEGGLIEGGTPGKDSVPVMAMPGEIIVPQPLAKNFASLVGGSGGAQSGDNQTVSILQEIKTLLQRPYTQINGDVLADETFVDTMIRKIDDRLQFFNGRFSAIKGS